MTRYSIGVDLGGTNLRVAAMSDEGVELGRIALPARYETGPLQVMDEIALAVDNLSRSHRTFERTGIGIGVPGYINSQDGVVVNAANLPGFQEFPIRDELQRRVNSPVVLENDANAAALGEMWMGAGRSVRDLILITLGTGIGGGIVHDGQILAGAKGLAGEIGHMTVFPDGNPCGCGNFGCLEKHASASAITAMARMLNLGAEITAAEVHQLAVSGNDRAQHIFEYMGKALGIAIANLITLFDFPLILLSGGPLPAWDSFAPFMLAEVHRRSFVYRRFGTRIEKATLGPDAGLFGAAYLATRSAGHRMTAQQTGDHDGAVIVAGR